MEKMQEVDRIGTQANNKQFITRGQVFLASFIGGPFAGCYMVGKNFKIMSNLKRAKQWYLGGIVSTFLLMAFVLYLPKQYMDHIPHLIIPIIYTSTIDSLFTQFQGKDVKQQIEKGYGKYSWVKVIGVSVLALGLLLVCVGLIVAFFPPEN